MFKQIMLAAWALVEDESSVIGLGGDVVGGDNHKGSSYKQSVRLVTVPPLEGIYKHIDCMSATELKAPASGAIRT